MTDRQYNAIAPLLAFEVVGLCIMVGFKLCGVVTGWWMVTSPLWAPAVAILFLAGWCCVVEGWRWILRWAGN